MRIIEDSWPDEPQGQNIGGSSPSGPTKSVPIGAHAWREHAPAGIQ